MVSSLPIRFRANFRLAEEGQNPYPPQQPDSRSSRRFDPPAGVGYGGRVVGWVVRHRINPCRNTQPP
eukprot:4405369-Prymnesium_polylepis.1